MRTYLKTVGLATIAASAVAAVTAVITSRLEAKRYGEMIDLRDRLYDGFAEAYKRNIERVKTPTLYDVMPKEQAEQVIKAIDEGENIVVSGGIHAGKSALLKIIASTYMEIANTYMILDEVQTSNDIEFVNCCTDMIGNFHCKGRRLLFTTHIREDEVLRRTFVGFSGIHIHVEINDGNRTYMITKLEPVKGV